MSMAESPFLQFLEAGVARGGFETDDALAVVLPLMRQALALHDQGAVAPLEGLAHLRVSEQRRLVFDPAQSAVPRHNSRRVERLQAELSDVVDVAGLSSSDADIDAGSLRMTNLEISASGSEIRRPVYLPGYVSWEHAAGHHDALTDIFSLGMILASVALGLDFTDQTDLEAFVGKRENLFALNARLNPVLASVIAQMTALNRHRRAQDLGTLIRRLETYREQDADVTVPFTSIKGFKESPIAGKRTIIQSRLRDRLFEISRRNRLIYFKPTMQTLNLTIASVPLLLDYRNIRIEQLFLWHSDLARIIADGAPMSLGKYLRFEDAPYISGTLDKIIGEARRDRAEYGFAQLRLVLCFLRWTNLKEAPDERINSPLLLLPVELTRKKGVRDNYTLDPTTSEAEVNPALRHHLKELYNLTLPETIDLREGSLDDFYEGLKAQIQASEPGVTLNKVDRPQIELIHERAKQRLDQYRRRLKIAAQSARPPRSLDYSYDGKDFRPLGLQLFLENVRPSPLPLREAAGAPPSARLNWMARPSFMVSNEPGPESDARVLETSRETFVLREGDNPNPYVWDFDLCSLTLGNFNYRKMTLVRDYANLIETDLSSVAFDTVFSLAPRPTEEAPPAPLALPDQHLIIGCDATQESAIARARGGRSFIIQGPPGTGKSQTITNLIADYVARGKRVLFVCEKRAAIDVVFHRLRQQGLDELCCLIHDSQTDKKAFIHDLKRTYETFLTPAAHEGEPERGRAESLKAIEQDLAGLQRFSEAMRETHPAAGVRLRSLLRRLVELSHDNTPLAAELEEQLPHYPLWLEHGEVVGRLGAALTDAGAEPCFARHPARWLGKEVVQAERPLEALLTRLDRLELLLDEIENALELSGLPAELWGAIEEVQAILEFAVRARPLAERDLVALLQPNSAASAAFGALSARLDEKAKQWDKAREKIGAWREPLSSGDTENALAQARSFEKSIFRFFRPAFWRLKKTLEARYDFSRHAVPPRLTRILEELAAEQAAREVLGEALDKARSAWRTEDPDQFKRLAREVCAPEASAHPSARRFVQCLAESDDEKELVLSLARIQARFAELIETLRFLLAEHQRFDFPGLTRALGELRGQIGALPDLLPILGELAELPEALSSALRHSPLPISGFEAAMARKSLNTVYREDRSLSRFEGRSLMQRMERLEKRYQEWLGQNARCIRAGVRRRFVEHVNLSSLSASQLDPEQKAFKKDYSAGRRDLEHEFGKTMRYKSIRELAAGQTGQVIQDLKPIWLMSPLSVSDTLPLDPNLFDVVIFDEASQIPVEEAIPAVYRSNQIIVVGDEMQLPPTTFFSANRGADEALVVEEDGERIEVDLDSDSFLTQSAMNLPSTLLAWHYRSRHESLISFSNAAFYSGNLYTIPDRQRALAERPELNVTAAEQGAVNVEALLARSLSFHFMEKAVYDDRRNAGEAAYIARLIRELLRRETRMSIGVVAFSEAQQGEIEDALARLAEEDADFASRFESESTREENDQFCGLFVKNLENVQGDERDIILLSICYGPDTNGKMLMNFGPINQRGGEKRLNVIFSRAKHHMAVVTSIRHDRITNDYNDGANSLKNFLKYAEAVSRGDEPAARRVLENLNSLTRKTPSLEARPDAVCEAVAAGLRARGYEVDLRVGQSRFRCDLAVRAPTENMYQLGVLVDTETHYANPSALDRYLTQPSILRAFGWRFALVLTKDWFHDPDDVLNRLERLLKGIPTTHEELELEDAAALTAASPNREPEGTGEAVAAAQHPSSGQSAPGDPDPPTTDAMPAPSPGGGQTRRFEFIEGNSSKFWEVTLSDTSFTVRFGRIGALGQSQSKSFADPTQARREAEKLIAEKMKKGYVERVKNRQSS